LCHEYFFKLISFNLDGGKLSTANQDSIYTFISISKVF